MNFPHGSKIFHKRANEIRMFQNQFYIPIDQVPVQIKIGENKLQKNGTLKDVFTLGNTQLS